MESKFNLKQTEEKILKFWSDNSVYKNVVQKNSKGPRFKFIDGPPYTTGAIHLGTAWNKVMKDAVLRYKRFQGYNVHDQPDYDMHGLPIEAKVEELLKIRNKKEIVEKFGLERFTQECRNFALKNLDVMNKQFMRLGVWMDWENPYMSINNSYIEGAWRVDIGWANYRQLTDAGVKPEHIDAPPTCTFCQIDTYFSFRKDSKETFGEIMGVIGFA